MVGHQEIDHRQKRDLFGGAITARIPLEFVDVSKIREVPDNQEVFAHAATDQSVIVELLQLDTDVPDDPAGPARYHFEALSHESGAVNAAIRNAVVLDSENFPILKAGDPHVHISLVSGCHTISKYRDRVELANEVNIYLACVRLPRVTTDLLVTFNDPVLLHPEGSSARLASSVANPDESDLNRRARVLFETLSSLTIRDWSLFLS